MSTSSKIDPDLPSPSRAARVVIDVTWTDGARAALQSFLQPNTLQPNTLQPNTLQPNTLQPNTLQPNTLQPNTLQPNTLQPNTLQPNTLQPNTANANTASDKPQNVRAWNRALRSAIALTCAQTVPHAHAAHYLKRHPDRKTWKIDATFVSDEEMTDLNARYRGKNRPTDVLSFAQSEEAFEDEPDENFGALAFGSPDEIVWGDLIIAVETAQRQAAERAHDVATEVCFLAIHGTLHLLGYDHQNSTQRRTMWRVQEKIFELATAGK